jgi:hypothetical protein
MQIHLLDQNIKITIEEDKKRRRRRKKTMMMIPKIKEICKI